MAEDLKSGAAGWLDYRAVWRWHFYAGLFCIPFVVILSLSGAVYLFKAEIERALDRPYDEISWTGEAATLAAQAAAALASQPGSTLVSYELPAVERGAGRFVVRRDGRAVRVYVHPQSCQVLYSIAEEDRPMRVLFRLHGELMMGDWGSHVVELAASWTLVLIVTGIYLWWPRQVNSVAGVLFPRLWLGRRMFWRDLHAVAGVWISALAIFILVTGLPWSKFWGDYFKAMRRWTGTAVAQQDWANSSRPSSREMAGAEGGGRGGRVASAGEHAGHGGSGAGKPREARGEVDLAALDRITATVKPLGLEPPVVIGTPGRSPNWTAKSMTANRPRRVDLAMDGATGRVVWRKDFADRHWVDRVVGVGIAAHEGRLFGWANQALGLATALGLVAVSVSGVVLWWRRREAGVLGAPPVARSRGFSWLLLGLVLVTAVYLPLFGASLAAVRAVEWAVLRRVGWVSRWLGLAEGKAAEGQR